MPKIDFSNVQQYVDKDMILSRLTEEQIYSRFCPDFPSSLMCSPLRPDKSPSFGFYQTDAGKWLWKDFNPAHGGGDVFEFVQRKCNTDFMGALREILKAFDLDYKPVYKDSIETNSRNKNITIGNRSLIQAVYTSFKERDYELWNSWHISEQILKFYKIKVGAEIWKFNPRKDIEKILWGKWKMHDPIYYWKSEYTDHIKAYRPLHDDKKGKWLSNCDNITDVQGYAQCRIKDKRQPLILTKSMKEVAFFRSWGFNAMAGHTEGSIFLPDFIRHIFKYCHPIITVYDNDLAGVIGATKMKKAYNIPSVFICNANNPLFKDPTDQWKLDYHQWYKTLDLISNQIDYYAKHQRNESVFRNT